jgi:hypothetical protein
MGGVIKAVVSVVATVATGGIGGGVLGGIVGGGIFGKIVGAVVNFAVGQILSTVASSLFGKQPKAPSIQASSFSNEAKDRTQTLRSSIANRRLIYGRIKVSGPLIFGASTGDENKFLHLVLPLATHEVDAIEDTYFDDTPSTDSKYDNLVRINKHIGTTDQAADSNLVSEASSQWTTNHRLQGVSYIYVRLEYNQDKFPNGAPNNIASIVRGKKLYDPRTSATIYSENPSLMIYDYISNSDYGLGADSDEIDSASFIAAANVCEERVLVTARNITFIVNNVSDNNMYQSGADLDFRTGDGVRVSSTSSLPSGLSAGVTYYFIESTYIAGSINKIGFKLASSYSNAIAGTAIDITDSGSGTHTITMYDQVRYNANGSVELSAKPMDIIEDMLTCLAGVLVYSQGKYFLHAGAATSATSSFDEDNLRDSMKVNPAPPKRELFNAIKGTYLNPTKFWQVTDFPPMENSTYAEEDGGETIWRDVEFSFTNDATRAQRIAKIHLEKSRQGITVDMPCNMSALKVAVWDVITITNTYLGWSSKEFRVLGWQFNQEGGIDLHLQEESSASYDWNNGNATIVDPAPNTNLPDMSQISVPGVPDITEVLYVTTDGSGVKTRADVSWSQAMDGFVYQYELQYKLNSESTWTQFGLFPASVTSTSIFDLAPNSYDFRVRSINVSSVRSDFATRSGFEIEGLTANPANMQNFSLNAINNNAHLTWNQAEDLDVKIGGTVRLRYSNQTSDVNWSSAIDLGPALPGVATQAVVPLLSGTYLIKSVDSTGNESETATTIISTIADIVDMNVIATATEDPTFSGSKQNLTVVDNVLKLDGALLFDDALGDFDDMSGLFDYTGGTQTSGVYDFATTIDAGAVTTMRITSSINALVYDYTQTFDEKEGDFDDATGFFDGDDITGVDIKMYVRTSSDAAAISGGPEWSAWRQFFVGDYTARSFQFQLRMTAENGSYNADISELRVSVDVPDITDSGALTTGTGGQTTVSYNKTFLAEPKIAATIHNGSTGDYFEISSISSSSFAIGVKNSAGSYVARSVTWLAKGY